MMAPGAAASSSPAPAVGGVLAGSNVLLGVRENAVALPSRPVTSGSDLAVAASTLTVAAAFGPLRRRVQSLVDRQFNRSRFDAQRTVETFGQRLRDEVDLEFLRGELTIVIDETMHPRTVDLWTAPVRGTSAP